MYIHIIAYNIIIHKPDKARYNEIKWGGIITCLADSGKIFTLLEHMLGQHILAHLVAHSHKWQSRQTMADSPGISGGHGGR